MYSDQSRTIARQHAVWRENYPKLDALRRKRNTGAYDNYRLVPQIEADLAGKLAVQLRKEVEAWIRKTHPEKVYDHAAMRGSRRTHNRVGRIWLFAVLVEKKTLEAWASKEEGNCNRAAGSWQF